ncbi:MAG: M67 family metallopeptidase [Flammeovirgaceae bacterium]
MSTLNIANEALKSMHEHAANTFPYECCGFFYGKEKGDVRIIEKAIAVTNSKEGDQHRRFEVSPLDYMKAERYAIQHNTTLLGIYHSHPNHPAQPSVHDLKQAVPFFSYIIISVMDGMVDHTTSWQLNAQGEFEEERILNLEVVTQ